MKISSFIERHFWVVLLGGIVFALWLPLPFEVAPFIPKLILGLMLFLVFLKIDAVDIIENMKNYKVMMYVTFVYMFAIPLSFYFFFRIFDPELAIGILLLTAMPAGVSTPALADIVKGNISFSMSLVIASQLIAPLTVPFLFWVFVGNSLAINKLLLLKDIAILVFIPLLISQGVKKYLPGVVKSTQHLFTSMNVFLLFSFVYVTLSEQRDIILQNPTGLLGQIVILYLVFIALHLIGYFACCREDKKNRITVAIGAAYMNNGLAIVLAISYFSPSILILMVLSQLPWNTLLAPFKKIIDKIN